MAIIGSAYVEIHALDKFLQRDIDNAMKKIKDPTLNLIADINLTPVRAKIKALRAELKNAPLQFNLETNYQEVVDNLDLLKDEQKKDPLVFNVDTNVSQLEASLENIKEKYSDASSSITANANTAVAEAQLAFAARHRRSTISLHIDPKTQKAFEGLIYTLIGALPADRVKAALQGIAGNFEMLSVGAAKLATVLGTVGAASLTTGANLFSIADDIAAVVGIVAVAPAALSAMAAGVATNIIAWKGFGEAITGEGAKGAEALAKLPPAAQKAAIALRGLGAQITKPVQAAFWEAMGESLQNTMTVIVPKLAAGLTRTGEIMGKMTSNILASFRELGESGGLDTLFANINAGWENASKGAKPFFDAMNTLAVSGSKFLGPFGDTIGNLGIKFNNFINEAERAGKIDDWINEAVNSFKNLGSILGSTIGIFNGLSDAAAMSGSASLEDFAIGMRHIADVVNGEPFQSKLVSILKDARSGAEALGDGFSNLSNLVGRSTDAIGEFLETSAQISGQLLTNITKIFDNTNAGTGLLTALWGLQDAMVILEPGFANLGEVLGDLGEIAGAVFESMAPGLNNLFETLAGVTEGLKDGVVAAMPIFNEFFQGILQAASGPLIAIAEGLGNLLEIFAQLPVPMQIVITSLGTIILFRSKIMDLFTGISGAFTRMRSGIEGDATGLSTSMKNMYSHFSTAGTHVASAANAMRLIPFAATTSGMGGISEAAKTATLSLGKAAGQGLRGALSGGAALLGGPWGIALAAGVGLVAAFGQAQADSAARVKEFSASLDQQTGNITAQTKVLVATNALDGATNGWDDFFRGVIQGSASVEETLDHLGISTKEFTDRIADPSGRDSYIKGLDRIHQALRDGVPITEEMAAAIGSTKAELEGITGNQMEHLKVKARGAADELTRAEIATKAVAEATGTSSAQAAILARNYDVLKNAASSAGDKFNALKQNLDILKDGSISLTESQKGVAQSLSDTKDRLASIASDAGGSLATLYSVKDGFDFASQAGRDLHTALSGTSDSILKIGTSALDQALKSGKSATDANSIAIQAMQPAIESLRGQLAAAGLIPAQIDAIVASFGLMPDQISTAISVEGTEEAQRKIFLTKLAADSFANGNWVGVISALPDAAKAAIADATGTAEAFKNGEWETVLKALDDTGPGKEAALASILSVTNGNYEAALKALNLTGDPVAAAILQAQGYANQDYTAELEATDLTGKVVVDATAVARAFANGDYEALLRAANNTKGPVTEATGAALGFSKADFTAALKAADSTAGGRAAAVAAIAQTTGANYLAWIKAAADQGSINSTAGALNALTATRYATIVAQWKEVGRNPGLAAAQDGLADGGIFASNGIRSYAKGGFSGLKATLSKFAGGSERHIAQIAKGAWPVRMWAEPETGGEAYIPLAMSKRLRSLKILEQVAKMFGYGLFKQFSDGGILEGMIPKTANTVAYAPSTRITPTTMISSTNNSDRPNVSLTINSTQGYTPKQLATTAVSELAWQFLNR